MEAILPSKAPLPKLSTADHIEEVSLTEFDPRRYQHTQGGGAREAYHDDEDSDSDMNENMGGAQRVQCAQQ